MFIIPDLRSNSSLKKSCNLAINSKFSIMKKILLCAGLLMGSLATVNAQVIYMDNFNDENISDWTRIDADGDGNNWGDIFQVSNSGGTPVSPVSIISRSWQGAPLTPNNWAITPAIVLPPGEGTITLTWKAQAAAAAWSLEKYGVYVGTSNSTSNLELSPIKWIGIHDGGPLGPSVSKSLDVSSLAGETIYIAFRHFDCTDQDWLSIDDVTVTKSALSTDSFFKANFAMYPNPAKNVLNISGNTGLSIENVLITDLNGRIVKDMKIGGVPSSEINVSDLTSGMYLITISSAEGNGTSKFMKN